MEGSFRPKAGSHITRLDDALPGHAFDPHEVNTQNTKQLVAVVTGAASGLGRAFVLALLKRGYDCVVADVDVSGLHSLQREHHGSRLLDVVPTDVSRPQDIQNLAEFAFGKFESVDLLVNSAGVLATGLSWLTPPAEWRRVLDVNLFSVIETIHHFVPRLIHQGHGQIVNIASMASVTSGAMVGPYSASKHGVLAVSECLARELKSIESKVQVRVVCPGAVRTAIAQELAVGASSGTSGWTDALKEIINHGMSPEELVERVFAGV